MTTPADPRSRFISELDTLRDAIIPCLPPGIQAADREDLIQDVWAEVCTQLDRGTYDPNRPLEPWVRGVANNVVARFWRIRYRAAESQALDGSDVPGPSSEARTSTAVDLIDEDGSPVDALTMANLIARGIARSPMAESRLLLREALGRIRRRVAERTWQVMRMRLAGFSPGEIVEAANVSPQIASNASRRLVAMLVEDLADIENVLRGRLAESADWEHEGRAGVEARIKEVFDRLAPVCGNSEGVDRVLQELGWARNSQRTRVSVALAQSVAEEQAQPAGGAPVE